MSIMRSFVAVTIVMTTITSTQAWSKATCNTMCAATEGNSDHACRMESRHGSYRNAICRGVFKQGLDFGCASGCGIAWDNAQCMALAEVSDKLEHSVGALCERRTRQESSDCLHIFSAGAKAGCVEASFAQVAEDRKLLDQAQAQAQAQLDAQRTADAKAGEEEEALRVHQAKAAPAAEPAPIPDVVKEEPEAEVPQATTSLRRRAAAAAAARDQERLRKAGGRSATTHENHL